MYRYCNLIGHVPTNQLEVVYTKTQSFKTNEWSHNTVWMVPVQCQQSSSNINEVSVFLVDILWPFQPDSLTNVVSGGQCVRYTLAGVHKRKLTKNYPLKLQTTQTLKY
jgi:hypothetical protein